jgi:sulfite exporter TauE/SafE
MTGIIIEGFLLGLSAGVYCVGSCMVFFMPYLVVEGRQNIFDNLKKISSFMLGRLIAYIIFAVVAGLIGTAYGNIFTARFSNICLVAASSFMIVYSLTRNSRSSGFCALFVERASLMRVPFFLGMLTGLNPCPPFLVGTARLWTLHDISGGVVLFIAFFMGTSIYMIPLVFVPFISKSERIKRIAIMVALISGVWFLFMGIAGLMR